MRGARRDLGHTGRPSRAWPTAWSGRRGTDDRDGRARAQISGTQKPPPGGRTPETASLTGEEPTLRSASTVRAATLANANLLRIPWVCAGPGDWPTNRAERPHGPRPIRMHRNVSVSSPASKGSVSAQAVVVAVAGRPVSSDRPMHPRTIDVVPAISTSVPPLISTPSTSVGRLSSGSEVQPARASKATTTKPPIPCRCTVTPQHPGPSAHQRKAVCVKRLVGASSVVCPCIA